MANGMNPFWSHDATASNSVYSSNVRVITRRTEIFVGSLEEKSSLRTSVQQRIASPTMPIYSNHMKNVTKDFINEAKHDEDSTVFDMISIPKAKKIQWPPGGKPKFLPELNIIQSSNKSSEQMANGNEQRVPATLETIVPIPEQASQKKETSIRKNQENHSRRVMNAMISFINGSKRIQPSLVKPESSVKHPPNSSHTVEKQNDPSTAKISLLSPHDSEPLTAVTILSSKSSVLPPRKSWFMNAKQRAQSVTSNFKVGPKPSPLFTPVL